MVADERLRVHREVAGLSTGCSGTSAMTPQRICCAPPAGAASGGGRHMNNLTLARPPALDATPIAYFFVTDRGALLA